MAAITLVAIPLATTLNSIILGLYLILKRKLGDTATNYLILYLLIGALWQISPVFLENAGWPFLSSFDREFLFLYGFVPTSVLLWLAVRAFLQIEEQPRWLWPLAGGIMLVLGLLDWSWPGQLPALQIWDGQVLTNRHLFLFISALTWGTYGGLTALTTVIAYFQTQSPRHRNRIQYLFSAICLLGLGQLLYLTRLKPAQDAGLLVHWLGAALFAYIIVRQNLADISAKLRELISFLVITVFTIAIYVLTIYAVQYILQRWFTWDGILGAVAAALLLTFTYPPLNHFFKRLLDRLLFGRTYDYSSVVKNYGNAINNVLYLADLASLALQQIDQALSVGHKALLLVERESKQQLHFRLIPEPLNDALPETFLLAKGTAITEHLIEKGQPLDQYSIDVSPRFLGVDKAERLALKELGFEIFVPIRRNGKLIGLLALGPKDSRQPYSVRDLNLLSTLADQTAIALANAQLFDTLQRNLRETTRIKNLMDNVFDSIGNGVITTDVMSQVTMLNRAAQEILEVEANGNLGKPFEEAIPALSNTALPLLVRDVIGHEKIYNNYEISPVLPGRGRVELRMSLAPLKDGRSRTQGVAIVMDDLTETKRLRAVRDMFRKYLSPAVVDRLPTDPARLQLGGQRQEATILFADLRGFTSFSEKLPPEDLVEILNQYLSLAAQSILTYEGTLDKFMGDAVMAIFNAPLAQPDHTLRAARAAAAIRQAIGDYQQQVGETHGLTFGVGIHVGEVVIGNIGTAVRMDYTAIGDTVNLAKRLQENAPGGRILLSESAYERVADQVRASPYQCMQVKGRSEAVQVYELLDVL